MEVVSFERSVPTEDLGKRTMGKGGRDKMKTRVGYVRGRVRVDML